MDKDIVEGDLVPNEEPKAKKVDLDKPEETMTEEEKKLKKQVEKLLEHQKILVRGEP